MSNRKARFGVVVFPGSNCDHDAYHALKHIMQQEVEFLWHKESDLKNSDVIILPGGFSYGDYLRCGAIARFSPIMKEVVRFAENGGYVIGICNGFQMLTETGLLPGALLRNASLQFICKPIYLRAVHSNSVFTTDCPEGKPLHIPIAHGEGNYFTDPDTLERLEEQRRVVFRYCDSDGNITDQANPNGSLANIAGIVNERGNVLGMMPHPERSMEALLGSDDGKYIFSSLISKIS
jgi:phosphoribosylformylglycinamidine synthase subunit PurQ / glutaminase